MKTLNLTPETAVTVVNKEHGLKGKRGAAMDALLKSKTVADFFAKLAKLDQRGYAAFTVNVAVENKLVKFGMATKKASKKATPAAEPVAA